MSLGLKSWFIALNISAIFQVLKGIHNSTKSLKINIFRLLMKTDPTCQSLSRIWVPSLWNSIIRWREIGHEEWLPQGIIKLFFVFWDEYVSQGGQRANMNHLKCLTSLYFNGTVCLCVHDTSSCLTLFMSVWSIEIKKLTLHLKRWYCPEASTNLSHI